VIAVSLDVSFLGNDIGFSRVLPANDCLSFVHHRFVLGWT
jgi:hypothetical protein